MTQNEEHLRLLSIFHYIVGGLTALFACFPIIHFIVGIAVIVMANSPNPSGDAPPAFIGWLFAIMAGTMILLGWSLAACVIATGNFLANRKHYMFCLVMAGIECIFMPFGTVLGVFTIVVLVKESVKKLFLTDQPMNALVQ